MILVCLFLAFLYHLDEMLNMRTGLMSLQYTGAKMLCLGFKPLSPPGVTFTVGRHSLHGEGQVVVELSAQVLKDLDLLCHSSLSGPERGWGLSGGWHPLNITLWSC